MTLRKEQIRLKKRPGENIGGRLHVRKLGGYASNRHNVSEQPYSGGN